MRRHSKQTAFRGPASKPMPAVLATGGATATAEEDLLMHPNDHLPLAGNQWLIAEKVQNSLGRFEATFVAVQTQLNRMEAKLGTIEREVSGQGKWIHTFKVGLSGLGVLIGWAVVYAVGPWVKSRLFPGS